MPKTVLAAALMMLVGRFGYLPLVVPLAAQPTSVISGTVLAADGTPIPSAIVTACAGRRTWTVRTSGTGEFAIAGLPEGAFTVTASAFGYEIALREGVLRGSNQRFTLTTTPLPGPDITGDGKIPLADPVALTSLGPAAGRLPATGQEFISLLTVPTRPFTIAGVPALFTSFGLSIPVTDSPAGEIHFFPLRTTYSAVTGRVSTPPDSLYRIWMEGRGGTDSFFVGGEGTVQAINQCEVVFKPLDLAFGPLTQGTFNFCTGQAQVSAPNNRGLTVSVDLGPNLKRVIQVPHDWNGIDIRAFRQKIGEDLNAKFILRAVYDENNTLSDNSPSGDRFFFTLESFILSRERSRAASQWALQCVRDEDGPRDVFRPEFVDSTGRVVSIWELLKGDPSEQHLRSYSQRACQQVRDEEEAGDLFRMRVEAADNNEFKSSLFGVYTKGFSVTPCERARLRRRGESIGGHFYLPIAAHGLMGSADASKDSCGEVNADFRSANYPTYTCIGDSRSKGWDFGGGLGWIGRRFGIEGRIGYSDNGELRQNAEGTRTSPPPALVFTQTATSNIKSWGANFGAPIILINPQRTRGALTVSTTPYVGFRRFEHEYHIQNRLDAAGIGTVSSRNETIAEKGSAFEWGARFTVGTWIAGLEVDLSRITYNDAFREGNAAQFDPDLKQFAFKVGGYYRIGGR